MLKTDFLFTKTIKGQTYETKHEFKKEGKDLYMK